MKHGELDTTGFLIEEEGFRIAYLTDCSYLQESSVSLVKGCSHAVLDGLRTRAHTTHLTFDQALEYASRIQAKKTWLTHICHDYSHEEINSYLAEKSENKFFIEASYDGLVLNSSS
jgi:phosphoribosyl 1,2-cyclic phosphate phosphodiesterase